ncbi:MAG: cyclase family protein [Bacteroidota bacterium]
MKLLLQIEDQQYAVDSKPIDISIPLRFDGPQPNSYSVPAATSQVYEGGGFVGDVRQGGSCNFETYTLTPHCNGTHTEGMGHIVAERLAVHELLQDSWIPTTLISVTPQSANATLDSYDPSLNEDDWVIDRAMIKAALSHAPKGFLQALVIRTLPNESSKMGRDYMELPSAFFTLEAMAEIRSYGVKHLLVDLPSVDRLFDEGKLNAHHIFWGLAAGQKSVAASEINQRTITEFIYVPNDVADGQYLLNLQIAPFVSDAAPSRPRLYGLDIAE